MIVPMIIINTDISANNSFEVICALMVLVIIVKLSAKYNIDTIQTSKEDNSDTNPFRNPLIIQKLVNNKIIVSIIGINYLSSLVDQSNLHNSELSC